jgi:hypothetical protein
MDSLATQGSNLGDLSRSNSSVHSTEPSSHEAAPPSDTSISLQPFSSTPEQLSPYKPET